MTAIVRRPETGLQPRSYLRRYLDHVRAIPRLDREEEERLARAYHNGDAQAGRRLVEATLYVVIQVAFQYHRHPGHDVQDLIQEGNLGLLRALDKYDPGRSVAFAAYARFWVRAKVFRFLMDHHRPFRFGTSRSSRKAFFNLNKARLELEREGIEPTIGALADRLGLEPDELIEQQRLLTAPLSLDDSRPDGRSWHDLLRLDEDDSPEAQAHRRQLTDVVRTCMDAFHDSLDARNRTIWNERLATDDPTTLAELGRRFGVSRERVRQLEKRLKNGFQQMVIDELGPDVDYAFVEPGIG